MTTHFVLYISPKSLILGIWVRKKLIKYQQFDHDAHGKKAVSDFAKHYRVAHFYLLVDSMDEDYRLESIPYVSRRQRQAIIERKLERSYRNTAYRAGQFLWRKQTSRTEADYLLVALTKSDILQEWSALVLDLQLKLVGVYLLPTLSALLLKKIAPYLAKTHPLHAHCLAQDSSAQHLLLCEQLSTTVRQSYFYRGRLYWSHIIANTPKTPSALVELYVAEAEKARLYLLNRQLISATEQLTLVTTNALADKQTALAHGIHIIQSTPLLMAFNFNAHQLAQVPELMYMQLLLENPAINLAPHAIKRFYVQSRAKHYIWGLNAIASLVFASISAWWLITLQQQSVVLDDIQQANASAQRHIQSQQLSTEAENIDIAERKVAVEFHNTLKQQLRTPSAVLSRISNSLSDLPNIQIDRLRWLLNNDTQVSDEAGAQLPIQAPLAANFLEIVFIDAQVAPFSGDYTAANHVMMRWIKALRALDDVQQLDIVGAPVNPSSSQSLQGTTDADPPPKYVAKFKLKIVLKPINKDLL